MAIRPVLSSFCFVVFILSAQICVSSGAALPILAEEPIEAVWCPNDLSIEPCTCEYDSPPPSKVTIRCRGYLVKEATIVNVLRELRRANEIPANRGIDMDWFILSETEMTQLDFTPYYGSRFSHLNFLGNAFLSKLVNSGNESDYGSIHAASSTIMRSPLLFREGYGDALRYFSNELTRLGALELPLTENEMDTELLPFLSSHTNLQELELGFTEIKRLNAGAFKGLQKLVRMQIDWCGLSYIGENAFNFTADGADLDALPDSVLNIYLGSNNLNQASFHPNSGLINPGRKTELRLVQNKVTSLPVEFFQSFLEAHPENEIDLFENPLFCDERLSWLKARRDEFESQFRSTYCINDPLTSPFQSSLVP